MLTSYTFKAQAPSNIAFVKYWGKYGVQLPINSSVSMTLKKSFTETSWEISPNQEFNLEVYLDDSLKPSFNSKIEKWISLLGAEFSFLKNAKHTIRTNNTFPHSTGIASSASAFAALSMCLAQIYLELKGEKLVEDKISELARLGSGSACRSIEGPICEWGENSLYYAKRVEQIHEKFLTLKDAICIVSSSPKKFSSTVGHGLMNEHRYKDARVAQAKTNCSEILDCIASGNVWKFGNIIEDEALSLHALMMTSSPSYTLLAPNSLEIIDAIREYRESKQIPIFFTLDAGPNVHVIYFEENEKEVTNFLNNVIQKYLTQNIIFDEVGSGARRK